MGFTAFACVFEGMEKYHHSVFIKICFVTGLDQIVELDIPTGCGLFK
jgi:hypothetical protein